MPRRRRRTRGAFASARRVSPSYRPSRLRVVAVPRLQLVQIEDRRLFHPERANRPARSFFRPAARLQAREAPGGRYRHTAAPISFADPRRVLVCIRRKMRREVIHAVGVAGSRVRKPRRNAMSSISCKG